MILRYYGSKGRIAPWICAHFPPHQGYVEPFVGGANVLLAKARSRHETINDLDGHVVNFFRVLRDPDQCRDLLRLVELTPYAKEEYAAAEGADHPDPVERARRYLVRSWQSYGRNGLTGSGWARSTDPVGSTRKSMGLQWATLPTRLAGVVERLRGVQIECEDALSVIDRYDRAGNLLYCDPPYLLSTRRMRTAYHIENGGEAFHEQLAQRLHEFRGPAVRRGHPEEIGMTEHLKKCDNPLCDRLTSLGCRYCCGPCADAHAGGYEIHPTGQAGHTWNCTEGHLRRKER